MSGFSIYIASSWKNQHAVEMLTAILRQSGHKVASFVENNNFEHNKSIPFDDWCWSNNGLQSFDFDTDAAMNSDLVIYVGPSGSDAWAEVGAAWSAGVTVFGLIAKGEQIGLMRRMVTWFDNVGKLIDAIDARKTDLNAKVNVKTCCVCGCTDDDCRQCIEKTGHPCHWVDDNLCSACADEGYVSCRTGERPDDSEPGECVDGFLKA